MDKRIIIRVDTVKDADIIQALKDIRTEGYTIGGYIRSLIRSAEKDRQKKK